MKKDNFNLFNALFLVVATAYLIALIYTSNARNAQDEVEMASVQITTPITLNAQNESDSGYMGNLIVVDIEEPSYSEEELELLALIIYQEQGGNASCDGCRISVGNVVLNRVNDDRFPNTIREVVTQKGQYHGQSNGPKWPKRASHTNEQEAVKRAYECAERVLNGESVVPENVVWQANFKQGKGTYRHHCKTYFCY